MVGPVVLKELLNERFDLDILLGEAKFILDDLDFNIFEGCLGHSLGCTYPLSIPATFEFVVDVPDIFSIVDSCHIPKKRGTNVAQVLSERNIWFSNLLSSK